MNVDKLNKWAELLLDTGKRNNLVNFKNTKASTVDIVMPNISELYKRADKSGVLEVYDASLEGDGDVIDEAAEGEHISKDEYIAAYGRKLKSNQILLYNFYGKPLAALNNLGKRARVAVEETGVNIAFIAMGFLAWSESENGKLEYKAPLLLMPVAVVHESTVDPYRIITNADEIIVNPTFGFKLSNEYGIKLPEFDDDVDAFLKAVQLTVDKLGWRVTNECKIGNFSFQKINMYRDLKDNGEVIVQNSAVQTILGEDGSDVVRPTASDGGIYHNVVDADSSQLDAIALAKSGASFVLQGPPGTGKSQTITNIIAELLSDGKKVLFVSEKLAALNVVYDKLKKAGLDEFCLELHSHKTNKTQIIGELCKTLKARRSVVSDRAAREIEIKQITQSKLDGYANELHAVRPVINKSLYSLCEEFAAYRKSPDACFAINDIESKNEDHLDTAVGILSRFAGYTDSIGDDYHDNVWYGFIKKDRSYEFDMMFKTALDAAARFNAGLAALASELKAKTNIIVDNAEILGAAAEFFEIAAKSDFIAPALFLADITSVRKKVETMCDIARVLNEYRDKLDAVYSSDIYNFDGNAVYRMLTLNYRNRLKRLFGKEYKSIKQSLKLCAKDGKPRGYKQAVASFDALRVYQTKRNEFDETAVAVKDFFGAGYADTDTDFIALINELKALERAVNAGVDLRPFGNMMNIEYSLIRDELRSIAAKYKELRDLYGDCERTVGSCFDETQFDFKREPFGCVELKIAGCADNMDKLDNWCAFTALIEEADAFGIKRYIDYAISQNYGKAHIVGAYAKLFYRQWIDSVLRSVPLFAELSRLPHDEAVKLFAQKDELDFEINKAIIKAQLSAIRPGLDMVAKGSAVAILLREGEKKRKQKGVRQLLSEVSELALTLKPCFLMSPLSVSTYLAPDMEFDTVVFDEASQIFPQDAVGAIYRGKQLIVVGDSKQMPPSNFFNAVADADENEEEDINDFESILDICSTCLPQCRLKWHYRSRYEPLIAFSNINFYDGELVTFPSAHGDRAGVGVDYCFVANGIFDRKSKTNLEEAKRVVELVFENFEKFPDRSVGVVAFSVAQQTLIDKLIHKRRQTDLSKEKFFRSDIAEPFFVKNLETVQGDERDTIIFSVAYAKGSDGKFLHNFGPLNREGGERRLNVAITRAKFNVKLVTGLHASDIDLTHAKSAGARLLREYIDYAENGAAKYLTDTNENSNALFDKFEFESEVCEFLREKGFRVDIKVGCSAFKIDIAVKMPQSNDYVLAIECDGENYRGSKSTRDRDRLRAEVLERMGWNVYRIWSTDWFRNKSIEKDRLFAAAFSAVDEARGKYGIIDDGEIVRDSIDVSFTEIAPEKKFAFPTYKYVDEHRAAENARFNYLRTVKTILEKEAPLAEEWLLKRTVFMFGREKVTDAVKRDYRAQMWSCAQHGIVRRNGYLYIKDKDVPMLRVPEKDKPTREIKYICIEELANGIMAIIEQNVTANRLGLYRLLSERLGASRLGDAVTERFNAALATLADKIKIEGDTISLI